MKNATNLKKSHLDKHNIRKITGSDYFRVLLLRIIGNFLILSSLFFIGKTFYKPAMEEIRYFIDKKFGKIYLLSGDKLPLIHDRDLDGNVQKGLLAKIIKIKGIEILVPEDPDFSIIIPKIGANSRIISNVNAADEQIYLDTLQKGVAQALGTDFPGQGGHIFLFAHSTDYIWNAGTYNAVFYLLYKLEKDDEIDLFYQGQRFVYKVIAKKIVDPSQVEYLTRKTNKEFLTLQTCWPPGTTLQRLLVFATRVVE